MIVFQVNAHLPEVKALFQKKPVRKHTTEGANLENVIREVNQTIP